MHCEKAASILDYDNHEKIGSCRENSGSLLDSQNVPKFSSQSYLKLKNSFSHKPALKYVWPQIYCDGILDYY